MVVEPGPSLYVRYFVATYIPQSGSGELVGLSAQTRLGLRPRPLNANDLNKGAFSTAKMKSESDDNNNKKGRTF